MDKSNVKKFPKKTDERKENYIDSLSPREIVSELDRYCLLYTSPSPRDTLLSRMPSSA